jgi:hypothetical protein
VEVVNVLDRFREATGIYGLGFRKESVAGLLIPLAFIVFVAIVSFWFFYIR